MASIELPLKICHTKVLSGVDERLNHASREGGRPAPATTLFLWRFLDISYDPLIPYIIRGIPPFCNGLKQIGEVVLS